MDIWRLTADGVTIVALALMCGSALKAWKRVDADTLIPMQIGAGGKVNWRARRPLAIAAWPLFCVGSLFFGMGFARMANEDSAILALVRIQMAFVFLAVQIMHYRLAFRVLQAEGKLRP